MSTPFNTRTGIIKMLFLLLPAVLFFSKGFSQTFPPASSCTSKDLTLVAASLPGAGICNNCTTGDSIHRTLKLAIYNKTGSTRTSFAFWGTLVIRNSDGTISSTTAIQGCGGPVVKADTTTLSFSQIGYKCGQSLTIKNLYLAWTDASPSSTCATLNPATINPKCGTQDSIQVNTGLDARFSNTNVNCAHAGAIDMTPLGGKAPYTYSWVASNGGIVPSGQSTSQDLTGLMAGIYTVTITDAMNCTSIRPDTITAASAVIANAGADFTITCNSNVGGKTIGEASATGFTYSWSPATGLSSATVSNPTANPASTTTYIVTKTDTASNCSKKDTVVVTVNTTPPTVSAGADFTITCTSNAAGKQIGETAVSGFTYSWSPGTGLTDASAANPTATPTVTTTYILTKTNSTTGCSNKDTVVVTVNNSPVSVNAGADFSITCNSNVGGKQIGESAVSGFTYSWSPNTGLSDATAANPTANPATTTSYIVTKTNSTTGCSGKDTVVVTVNNSPVSVSAGADFTITCTSNTSGKQIGETAVSGFSYSWSPTAGLSDGTASNPNASPASTTTYIVTKTSSTSGCSSKDTVVVTVTSTPPAAPGVCVVQPSLCGPATGSVTITSPLGADYQYSVDNGQTWQASTTFSSLAAGSVTGIKVKTVSTGCISTATSCDASDCSQSNARLITSTQNTTTVTNSDLNSQFGVKAFPNPFNNAVKFVITVPEAGNGSVELFNILGQKVKTIFQGHMQAGTNTFQVYLPSLKTAQFVYVVRMGDKRISGKLLQLNY